MEIFKNIKVLPEEIMIYIFAKLNHKELLKVVSVCQDWKAIGESPSLWKNYHLMVKPTHFDKLYRILSLSRFKQLQTLFLNGGAQRLDNDVMEIISNSKISKLTLKSCSLVDLCPTVLSKGLCNMKILNMVCTHLNKLQVDEFMTEISRSQTKLKELRFDSILSNSYGYGSFVDLSEVPADIISAAINKIELLELGRTELTKDQLTRIFENMASETKVQNLTISGNVVTEVSADIIAEGLSNLESASLNHTKLSKDQVERILEKAIETSEMKHLDLTLNQITGVREELLTLANKKLKTFHCDVDYDDDYDFEYFDGYSLDDELFDYSLDDDGGRVLL